MGLETLFGYNGPTPDTEEPNNVAGSTYANAYGYDAVAAFYEVYPLQSGNIKCGLYEWTGSYPMPARDRNNSSTSVTANQWNQVPFSTPYALENGNNYRVMAGGDAAGVLASGPYGASSPRNAPFDYATGLPAEYNSTSSTGIDYAIRVLGYFPPTIVSVGSGGEVTVGASASISGTNLIDSAGQPTIELCNNADYASATVKVTQSNVSCTDTTGTFDVVQGGLTADTTVYAFVTTGLGQRNTTGVGVTLNGSGSGTETTPDPISQTQSIENVLTAIDTASIPDPVQQTQTVPDVDTGIATVSGPESIEQAQSVENVLSAIDTTSTPGPISQVQTVSAVETGSATASTPESIEQTQTITAVETAAESDTTSTPGPISQVQTVSAVDTALETVSIPDTISQIQSIQDVGSLRGSISTPDPVSCYQSIVDVQTVYTSVSVPNAIECIQYIFDVPTESSDITRGVLVVHTVRDSIVKILGDSSAGNFNVIGYKEISIDESELTVPLVTVQIDRSDFDNGSSGILGPYKNDAKCIITIIGSAASDIDLSVIEDPSATVEQKQAAIAAMKSAEENAQKLIEYAIHDIFNIINGVDNFDLGQDDGVIKSRSLSGFKVNDKMVSGELVTVFAEMYLDFTVNEDVTGVTPIQADSNFATGSVLVYNDESVETPQSMDLDIIDVD